MKFLNQSICSVRTGFFKRSPLARKLGSLLFLLTLLLTFPEIPGENTVFPALQDFFTGVFAPTTRISPDSPAKMHLFRQTPEQADLSTVALQEDYPALILNCNLRNRQGIPGGTQATVLPQTQNLLEICKKSDLFPTYIQNTICEWAKSCLPARASPAFCLLYT